MDQNIKHIALFCLIMLFLMADQRNNSQLKTISRSPRFIGGYHRVEANRGLPLKEIGKLRISYTLK